MKLILMSIIALLIFAAPVFSELTVEDLEKIGSIVKESEGRVMLHIADKFGEVDKRLNLIFGFVIGLISLIVIVVGIPQIIIAWRGQEERTQKKEIQELRQEIEALKQLIASP